MAVGGFPAWVQGAARCEVRARAVAVDGVLQFVDGGCRRKWRRRTWLERRCPEAGGARRRFFGADEPWYADEPCKNLRVAGLAETVEELRSSRTHGGSWMARRAVEALLEVTAEPAPSTPELLERLLDAGRQLAAARPAMGAIAHAVGRLVAAAHTASHLEPTELQRLVTEEGRGLLASRDRASASIAVHLSPLLRDALVLTHSASATVREAVLRTPPERLLCTVSAPFEEGRRFAAELAAEGLNI